MRSFKRERTRLMLIKTVKSVIKSILQGMTFYTIRRGIVFCKFTVVIIGMALVACGKIDWGCKPIDMALFACERIPFVQMGSNAENNLNYSILEIYHLRYLSALYKYKYNNIVFTPNEEFQGRSEIGGLERCL